MTHLVTLPPPSNYPAYVRAVSQIPVLSASEEKNLVDLWRNFGSTDAAKQLVLSNLHLVVKVVKNHEGYGLSQGDLAQEGTVGLMKAVHKFDSKKNVKLSTYAWYWIEAEIKEFILKNWRLISFGTSSLAKKIFFGYRKTVQSLRKWGEERTLPSDKQIAEVLNISVTDAQKAQAYFLGQDTSLQFDDGEDKDILETLWGPSHDFINKQSFPFLPLAYDDASPLSQIEQDENEQQKKHLYQALSCLPPRTRSIVEGRFLLEKPKTLSDLSAEHHLSIERVRQLEKKGLEQLKQNLKKNIPAL